MDRPRICAVITSNDLEAVKSVTPLVDLFEVRMDLIGAGWPELVGHLKKPWIACNRMAEEGGCWQGTESGRIEELLGAIRLGAAIVDIELGTPGVETVVKEIKKGAECLVSYHDFQGTPPSDEMREIVQRQAAAGADICKLVTTAHSFADNLAVLQLIADFPRTRVVAFAMGDLGYTSRVFSPLVGGDFIYASIEAGRESAAGQVTAGELRKIYGMMQDGR